jgi:hypothetical protein
MKESNIIPYWFSSDYEPTVEDLVAKLEYDRIQLSIAEANIRGLEDLIESKQKALA